MTAIRLLDLHIDECNFPFEIHAATVSPSSTTSGEHATSRKFYGRDLTSSIPVLPPLLYIPTPLALNL